PRFRGDDHLGQDRDAGLDPRRACALRAPQRRQVAGRGLNGGAPPNGHEPPGGRLVLTINRRRPTLPGPCGPSTIGAEGLNCSVRNGKRCFPLAIATGNWWRPAPPGPSKPHSANDWISNIRQALDPLVPVSYECHHSSSSG